MKKVLVSLMAVLIALHPMVCFAWPEDAPANTIIRICDGIGRQYSCVSSNMANTYGFGGSGDTLATDSTVARGVIQNIKRCKESGDGSLAQLLPFLYDEIAAKDSAAIMGKWGSVIFKLNNFYSSEGGLNGHVSAKRDSGRLSPRFATVARANGIYLAPTNVFPPARETALGTCFGFAKLTTADSTITYSDSNSIDSSKYGAFHGGAGTPGHISLDINTYAGAGSCSLIVYGCNQNLIRGRTWKYKLTGGSANVTMPPTIATDSCYNVDSAKIKTWAGTLACSLKFYYSNERTDSL